MIDRALKFIADEINIYLKSKLSFPDSSKIVLDNIAKLQDNSNGGSSTNRIILSLVNIEEDRLYKNPENFFKTDDNKVVYQNPAVPVNVYCIFAYNHGESDTETTNHYEEGLMYISYVIQFFQHRNVFTSQNSPALDPLIEKLIAELHSLGFEQLNHLWAILGGKYLPSVMYKFRLLVIDENLQQGSGELIRNVNVNTN
jgi:hypothetical protein